LQQPRWVKLLCLGALTRSARLDEVQNCPARTGNVKVHPKSVECLFNTFVADAVLSLKNARQAWRRCRNVDFATHGEQPVHQPPLIAVSASQDLVAHGTQHRVADNFRAKIIKEHK
jgi:hypothetical protein